MPWYYDPHSGGQKIPPKIYDKLRSLVHAYEKTRPWYPKHSLKLRFRGQFCYVDGCEEGKEPFPLGRLRYFSEISWSLAFYTYSNERYEPCLLPNGTATGTMEQGINVCEMYLWN